MIGTRVLLFRFSSPVFKRKQKLNSVEIPSESIDRLRLKLKAKLEANEERKKSERVMIHPTVLAAYQELIKEGYYSSGLYKLPDYIPLNSGFKEEKEEEEEEDQQQQQTLQIGEESMEGIEDSVEDMKETTEDDEFGLQKIVLDIEDDDEEFLRKKEKEQEEKRKKAQAQQEKLKKEMEKERLKKEKKKMYHEDIHHGELKGADAYLDGEVPRKKGRS